MIFDNNIFLRDIFLFVLFVLFVETFHEMSHIEAIHEMFGVEIIHELFLRSCIVMIQWI